MVQNQLNNAFNAADAAGFKLFFSFDYAAQGAWNPNTVISTINAYSGRASHFRFGNNQPLASTFEGPANAPDWGNIKAQTGAFFIPNYSSQGPQGAANEPNVDGLFSWDAWPNGAMDMTDGIDKSFVAALGGRPYMMPVSPWFYTNLPAFNKNWLWRGDDLWHERWQQVLDINPALVEIVTWNDYGESHYIAAQQSEADLPTGSNVYVDGMPHDQWLKDLPFYIAAYKKRPAPTGSHVTMWYRVNPGTACSADGTTCNTDTQGQTEIPPQNCDVDAVFFTAFMPSSVRATVSVTIGGNMPRTVTATSPGIFHSSLPFNGQQGTVTISVSGSDGSTIGPVRGAAITSQCTNVNWNAWVGGS